MKEKKEMIHGMKKKSDVNSKPIDKEKNAYQEIFNEEPESKIEEVDKILSEHNKLEELFMPNEVNKENKTEEITDRKVESC